MGAAENVKILSKKGNGHIILTIPTPLACKIAEKMKWRPNSVPLEPKNWLMLSTNERVLQKQLVRSYYINLVLGTLKLAVHLIAVNQGRRQLSEIRGAKLKTGGGGKVLTVNYCSS